MEGFVGPFLWCMKNGTSCAKEDKNRTNNMIKYNNLIQLTLLIITTNFIFINADNNLTYTTEIVKNLITVYDKNIETDKNGNINYKSNLDSIVYTDIKLCKQILENVDTTSVIASDSGVLVGSCMCGLSMCAKIIIELENNRTIKLFWACPESDFQCVLTENSNEKKFELNKNYNNTLKNKLQTRRYRIFKTGKLWDCL